MLARSIGKVDNRRPLHEWQQRGGTSGNVIDLCVPVADYELTVTDTSGNGFTGDAYLEMMKHR